MESFTVTRIFTVHPELIEHYGIERRGRDVLISCAMGNGEALLPPSAFSLRRDGAVPSRWAGVCGGCGERIEVAEVELEQSAA